MPRSVLLADPDPGSAPALAAALRGSEWEFIGAVENGRALIDAVFARDPWAIVCDLSLPDHPQAPTVGWAATIPHLREIAPAVHTIVSYAPAQLGLVPACLAGGARAHVEKPLIREELLAALERCATDAAALPFFARSRRVAVPLALRFRQAVAGHTTTTRVGLVRNISETGLLIAIPEPLPIRSVLFADIELPDRTVVRGRGQVVRQALLDRTRGIHEYGVALFDLEPSQRGRFRDFIARVLAGEPIATALTERFRPELRQAALS